MSLERKPGAVEKSVSNSRGREQIEMSHQTWRSGDIHLAVICIRLTKKGLFLEATVRA